MKYKLFLFSLFFLAIFILDANGDTIYLKNGRKIEGLIKKEIEDGVWLDVGSGAVKLRWEQIENIYRSTPDEVKAIRQQGLKREKSKGGKAGIGGYEEKLLEENPEIKQILTRHILSRKILDGVVEAVRPYSLKKNLKLSLGKTIHWWIRHIFVITFLLVGLFVLPSVSFNARFGRVIRIVVTLIIMVSTYYLLNLLTNSLKFISIYYK